MSDLRLTTKQEAFCLHYTTIGEVTFGNGTRAAIAASYAESAAAVNASKLLKLPHIQERIRQLHSENMERNNITVDKILADLEHDKLMARENKQFAVAKGCTELQGKYLAMFTDRSIVDRTQDDIERDESKAEAARRLARLALEEEYNIIPAEIFDGGGHL